VDGKSFRELVPWRGSSLLWSASTFLLERTAGPRCARTAEIALRLLEATAPAEVDAAGLAPADRLLLGRACRARGILFHGPALGPGRARATAAPRRRRGVVAVALAELARWQTRRVRRAASSAAASLYRQLGRLRETPGLTESYAHRGVGFADLAARDLEALLGHLEAAVRQLESVVELVVAAGPAAVLLAVPARDERRSLVHACAAAGVGAVVLRLGEEAADRADGGPQPLATVDWKPGDDPGPVIARLREAVRGRVGAE
jgi:hypothetical protein